jgi:hypothetical protein
MSRPDSSWNHDSLDPDTITARTTVAYSIGHVDIEPHLGGLNHIRAGRAPFPVHAADLVAVNQHADVGTYTWESVSRVSLGPVFVTSGGNE